MVFENLIIKNASSSNMASVIGFGPSVTTNNFVIKQGDMSQNNTAPLLPATTYFGTGSLIKNVKGYNPQGFKVTSPAVPASGTALKNTGLFPVRIYLLTAGVGTAYTITDPLGDATTISTTLTAGMEFTLDAGASITLTYTTAPTWAWYGE